MKKLLAISLALNAAFVVWISLKELTVHAAGGRGTPIGNGDVNGDGTLDIADAIYIIQNQFFGGPAPVPIECPEPPPTWTVCATGETKCYDAAGNEIDCMSADFPGQDGFYRSGCPFEGRFVDNGDGTVTDTCTVLMWQKTSPATKMNWQQALKYCEDLNLGGHSDWRMPNIKEIATLNDYTRYNPSTDPVFATVSGWYWSSTTLTDTPTFNVVFDFIGGAISSLRKSDQHAVRAVRTGP